MRTITDLPPELLSAIAIETARIWPHLLWKKPANHFRMLEDDWDVGAEPELHHRSDHRSLNPKSKSCRYCTRSRLGFITLTHVSRAFRAITIGTPGLWTTINVSRPKSFLTEDLDISVIEHLRDRDSDHISLSSWTEAFLSRSLALPLEYTHYIDWYDGEMGYDGFHIGLFDRALPRIRTLHLNIDNAPSTLDIGSKFLAGAHSLESLIINCVPARPLAFPDDFASTRLQHLTLFAFKPTEILPWQHTAVRNLTSLRLAFINNGSRMNHASFLDLFNGLRTLNVLQTLYLICIPDLALGNSFQDIQVDVIDFSRLRSLSLYGHSRGVAVLLQNIRAPSVHVVDLVCLQFTAEMRPVLAKLAQWVPGLAPSSAPGDIFQTTSLTHDASDLSLTLGLSRVLEAEAGLYHFRITADWMAQNGQPPVNLSGIDALAIVVPTIMDVWAAPQTKRLILMLDECSSPSLRQYLAHFTAVSSLTVQANAARVVESMTMQRGAQAAASRLFPALESLKVAPASAKHKTLDNAIERIVKARARLGQAIKWEII
ncbi:hypothetical protein PENSPDRAFT_654344 [Peniophora sp. CONT]|nr:hypothetical protein PENSPDRAFT_654344 [Peniophora sp. CONT]